MRKRRNLVWVDERRRPNRGRDTPVPATSAEMASMIMPRSFPRGFLDTASKLRYMQRLPMALIYNAVSEIYLEVLLACVYEGGGRFKSRCELLSLYNLATMTLLSSPDVDFV
ncbi:hypothetical protein Hypma_014597 [Hypsizygus marmoreus]|uniref:Uncharacterized protein n=1 Tax=Hypsizygus marmoreus TaxID=39966 RepID=A0A369JBY8_HYPMA|nr:hypothetical protein Hypma_014597 [Hypsizygus marmoreus]